MTTNADAWQAGIDAVVADNTLNRGGFADAIRAVATVDVSNAEATAWIDAVAVEYERIGIINNPSTYPSLRGEIISEGAAVSRALFDSLGAAINGLPETDPINMGLRKLDLRAERDEVDISITTMRGFKTGATRQVKDALDLGIGELRAYKERIRDELRQLGELE